MRNFRIFLLALVPLLLCCSCGEKPQRGLLDTVPDDSRAVAVVNLDRLFKEAGCDVNGDKVELLPELNVLMCGTGVADDKLDLMQSLVSSGSIGLEQVVAYADGRDRVSVTFRVKDKLSLCSVLDSCRNVAGEAQESDGYVAYAVNGGFIVIGDTQGWVLNRESHDIIADVQQMLQQTQTASVARIDWMNERLSGGQIFSALVQPADVLGEYYSDQVYDSAYVSLAFDSERDYASFDAYMYSKTGQKLELNRVFEPVDASFARYIYPNDIAAFAMGIPADCDWDGLFSVISRKLSYKDRMALSVAMPYLKEIAGTVAVAVGPVAGAQSLAQVNASTWEFVVILPFMGDRAVELCRELKSWAKTLRFDVKEIDGSLQYKNGDVTYAMKAVDGNLIFSNREIVERGDSRLSSDVFEGRSFAFVGEVAYNSEMMKALEMPFGFNIALWGDDSHIQLRVRLNGNKSSFLQSVLSEAARRVNG